MIYIGQPFSFAYKTMTGGLVNSITDDDIYDAFAEHGEVGQLYFVGKIYFLKQLIDKVANDVKASSYFKHFLA